MLVTLVVEPQEARRESLIKALQRAGYAVASAESPDAIEAGLSPDVVVISADVDVALRDGVVGRVGPVPVIRDDGDVDALLLSLRQHSADARPLVVMGTVTVDLRTRTVLRADGSAQLSDKESALLAWMLSRQGAVVPRSELLVRVWGYHPDSTSRTVDVTLGRLREKIEEDPKKPRYLRTIRGEGYRLVDVGTRPVEPRATSAVPASIPTDLLGRDDALRALSERLAVGRVTTLLGPPGVGKTTLSRALLQSRSGIFVALEQATTPDGVREAMAHALGLPRSEDDASRVAEAVAAQRVELVVLDNAEQCVRALAEVYGEWRDAGVSCAWVVTTRLRLRLSEEEVVDVGPLDLDAAVALFLRRARARKADYAASAEELSVVRGLVQDIDRNPLAIELAAARVRLFSPTALRARIGRSLSVLKDDRRDRSERQLTLSAAVAWSWDLLSQDERQALQDLSVAVGGIGVADAEALIDVNSDALDVIESLVDHSLIKIEDDRLSMLVAVREFAALELVKAKRNDAAERRHMRIFSEHAVQWASDRDGKDAWQIVHTVRRERANLVAALRLADTADRSAALIESLQGVWELDGVTPGELTLASESLARSPGPAWVDGALSLCPLLERTGRVAESAAWLERVVALPNTPSRRMRVLYMQARQAQRESRMDDALALYAQAMDQPADDPSCYSRALLARAILLRTLGDLDAAMTLAKEGIVWAEQRGVPPAALGLRGMMAAVHMLSRRYDQAIAAASSTLQAYRLLSAEEPVTQMLGLKGMALSLSGRADEALVTLDEAVERGARLGLLHQYGRLLGARARAHWFRADFEAAREDAEQAMALNRRCSDTLSLLFVGIIHAVATRELGRPHAALQALRDCEKTAATLKSPRGVFRAAHQRMVTALVLDDPEEALQAARVGVAGCAPSEQPVAFAWLAVAQRVAGQPWEEALRRAEETVDAADVDTSVAGLVALVSAMSQRGQRRQTLLVDARQALADDWQPAWTNALDVVEGRGTPRFDEARVLGRLYAAAV